MDLLHLFHENEIYVLAEKYYCGLNIINGLA